MLLHLMNDSSVLPQYLNANSSSCMTMNAPEHILLEMTNEVCVEPSQARQRRVRFQEEDDRNEVQEPSEPSPKRQRRVRFPEVEWQEIFVPEPHYDETPDDKATLWYQQKELFRIKWNNRRMLREYRLVAKHIQESTLVEKSQDHYSAMKHSMEENMRGLEIYRSKRALGAAKERRDASQRIVMLEQQFQKRIGISDPNRIRQVSRSVTQTSKVIAYAQGKKDALFVGKAVPSHRMTHPNP